MPNFDFNILKNNSSDYITDYDNVVKKKLIITKINEF